MNKKSATKFSGRFFMYILFHLFINMNYLANGERGNYRVIITILLFIFGLILVLKGGDWFVDSSVNIAKATGLPEIFIGATIVSIATTLPEVTVSVTAAIKDYTTMSVGNGVGSIICNTGFILALVNILFPTKVKGRVFKVKSLIMIIYMIILFFISLDRSISVVDGTLLILLLIIYIFLDLFILKYKKDKGTIATKEKLDTKRKIKTGVYFIIGISSILVGANLLINNGVKIAKFIGVPEAVISLTLIALGTSLPELISAITSMVKGYTSLSAGNIIGANILNIVSVVGFSAFINPLKILKQNLVFDFPVAIILMIILTIPTYVTEKISRIQGIVLMAIYLTYLIMLYSIYI